MPVSGGAECGVGCSIGTPSRRMTSLDGLRGIAAIAVVMHHAKVAPLDCPNAYLAVDFFFLLSGFVMGRSYDATLRSGVAATGFTWLRIQRLYPMLFIGGCLGWYMFPSTGADGYFGPVVPFSLPKALISQFLLVPFLVTQTQYPFNGPQWSILFEIIANHIHALFGPVLTDMVLMGIVLTSLGILVFTCQRFGTIDFGWGLDNVLRGLPRVTFGYFAGVLLFRYEGAWAARTGRYPFWFVAGAVALALAMPHLSEFRYQDIACLVIVFPVVLGLGRNAYGCDRIAAKLGTISYPLYALHMPLLAGFELFYSLKQEGPALGLVTLALALAGCVCVAWAAGHWIDEPLNALRRRKVVRSSLR